VQRVEEDRVRKRRFSETERAAIFKAHNGHCHICGEPCILSEMHVDHVIPESIAEIPNEMKRIRELFTLPEDFEVNAFENWAPAHGSCNRAKADIIYLPSLVMRHVIEKTRRLGPEARKIARKALSDREIARAKSALKQAHEKGQLSNEDLKSFVSELLGPSDEPDFQFTNLAFLRGLFANASSLRAALDLDFVANGVSFSVKVTVNNGIPEIDVTAKVRRVIRSANIFDADVEVEMTVSTAGEPRMSFNFHRFEFVNAIHVDFIKALDRNKLDKPD